MTDKRFVIPNQLRVIRNTETGEEAIFYDTEDVLLLEKWLNDLYEENQKLKKENNTLKNFLKEIKEVMKK